MPVASIARAINPPSASISATRCPFAVPPIAGLHGMCATVSSDNVQIATRRPRRAAAYAASHPACPAPITITSYCSAMCLYLNAKAQRRQGFFLEENLRVLASLLSIYVPPAAIREQRELSAASADADPDAHPGAAADARPAVAAGARRSADDPLTQCGWPGMAGSLSSPRHKRNAR